MDIQKYSDRITLNSLGYFVPQTQYEVEMLELISEWYREGFSVLEKLKQVHLENKNQLVKVQERLLAQCDNSLLMVLRSTHYRTALHKIISSVTPCSATEYLSDLLIRSENEIVRH